MTDWERVPVFFGAPMTEAPGVIRPSAYAIISDPPGYLAVVRTPLGVFLPGGGSESAESPEATVTRETHEECGLAIQLGAWRRTAIEHVFSVNERVQFEKRSTFCDAVVLHPVGAPTETDHTLEWMSASESTERLTPPSHRWAVGEWMLSRRVVR